VLIETVNYRQRVGAGVDVDVDVDVVVVLASMEGVVGVVGVDDIEVT